VYLISSDPHYIDGSIAFWAIEDENQPLLVRTLEELDINVVDGEKLSEALGEAEDDADIKRRALQPLEPIFKLSWSGYPNSSDPRGGTTTLTILGGGGSVVKSNQGVASLLLPAFNPVEAPEPDSTLNPSMRAAMRESVLHTEKMYTYSSSGVVHDYLLLPRENPHFSGCFDPVAIIVLSDDPNTGTRSSEIYQFPPPIFNLNRASQKAPDVPSSDSDPVSQSITSTLECMTIADDPRRLILPTALWTGSSNVVWGDVVKLESAAYKSLLHACEKDNVLGDDYGLRGGLSWLDDTDDESRHAKVSNLFFPLGR
jgi:syntaxin-binding protein 5